MFRTSKIFLYKIHKNFRYKEEYMNLPTLYLVGFPVFLGLSIINLGIFSKPTKKQDITLNNYHHTFMFWTPL